MEIEGVVHIIYWHSLWVTKCLNISYLESFEHLFLMHLTVRSHLQVSVFEHMELYFCFYTVSPFVYDYKMFCHHWYLL